MRPDHSDYIRKQITIELEVSVHFMFLCYIIMLYIKTTRKAFDSYYHKAMKRDMNLSDTMQECSND